MINDFYQFNEDKEKAEKRLAAAFTEAATAEFKTLWNKYRISPADIDVNFDFQQVQYIGDVHAEKVFSGANIKLRFEL